MAETLENQILHALGQVFDHDKDKNIVSLGIVKNINVEAGNVNVILEFERNDSNLQKILSILCYIGTNLTIAILKKWLKH